ncbi:MAG TPA: sugar phosphate isomerase/epimerase family protein [Phycisphaerae bacterium]|nr:sugar phosphate isomerase/epimerase family protein [Phycisphaerae bacterium]HRY67337.1 sugar phosphate isomerase/epimerase family protein [Phycisphaerae bacterium]HSA28480.1 sugar phosphate isomerase/epimerase family protein [Phycisphaerae bacterium]
MEKGRTDRRSILKSGVVAGAGLAGSAFAKEAVELAGKPPPAIRKAVKIGMTPGNLPLIERFTMLKELGFDGVELDSPSTLEVREVLDARDRSGLPIHGVVDSVHWNLPLSHPDAKVRRQGLDGLIAAIRDAKAYGAASVLLVPATVDKRMTYDAAYKRSQEEIRKVIPLATELGVVIAIENVWNSFLLSPLEAARYIDEFNSPAVRFYFDVGNVVRLGWPEQWIRILGKRVLKIDVKEFSRKKMNEQGLGKGFDVELMEGDCDWPAVMKALREIGFSGWFTAEVPGGDRERLKAIAARMDRIIGG